MDYTESKRRLKNYLKKKLSSKRYYHSVCVAEMAMILAPKKGLNKDKAYFAGLFHDIAKELPFELQEKLSLTWSGFSEEFRSIKELIHAPAGAALLRDEYDVIDRDILEAVAFHTTGHPRMGLLAKIVFVSDYISLDRDHVDDNFREWIFQQDIDNMVLEVLEHSQIYFRMKKSDLLPESKDLISVLRGSK